MRVRILKPCTDSLGATHAPGESCTLPDDYWLASAILAGFLVPEPHTPVDTPRTEVAPAPTNHVPPKPQKRRRR